MSRFTRFVYVTIFIVIAFVCLLSIFLYRLYAENPDNDVLTYTIPIIGLLVVILIAQYIANLSIKNFFITHGTIKDIVNAESHAKFAKNNFDRIYFDKHRCDIITLTVSNIIFTTINMCLCVFTEGYMFLLQIFIEVILLSIYGVMMYNSLELAYHSGALEFGKKELLSIQNQLTRIPRIYKDINQDIKNTINMVGDKDES